MTHKTLRQRLLEIWPDAIAIRFEGKCHCRANALMSFQLPGDTRQHSDGSENCGFFCGACGFSNAGSRERRP